jgi:methionyl-tRNA formyltransferase
MKTIFMGFQKWGYVTLEGLLESRHTVELVITHPNSNHKYESIWNDSVKELALKHRIQVVECRSANTEELVRLVSEKKADVIVSSDWRTWLSPEFYSIPKFGSINIHDALLPKYGGFAPINWAIVNGETETGVTVHQISDELDLGDILLQVKIPIAFHDTATDIFFKTLELFPKLTLQALDLIEYGKVEPIPQDKSKATFFHKRSERDSLIDWTKSNIDIYNLIRAQSDPYPNAYTYHKNKKLKIKKALIPESVYCGSPGRVFCRLNSGVVVVCGAVKAGENQGLLIEQLQEENGEVVEASRYFNKMGCYLGIEK